MTSLLTERPAYAHLMQRRRDAHHRVRSLTARLREGDPRLANARAAMEQGLELAKQELAKLDAELAGGVVEALPLADPSEQARIELRNRLQHLLMVVERHAPPECERAAANLRRAVHLELRRLDGLNVGTVPILRRARQHEG